MNHEEDSMCSPPPLSGHSDQSKNHDETRSTFHPYDLTQLINVHSYYTLYDFQLYCK